MLIRQLRLTSGLVMLTYISMHFLNHAAGLISIPAMERMLLWVKAVWTPWPGQTVLYASFLVHYLLALWSLWQRRTLRMRPAEFAQIALGFAIPIMLARHVVNNRIGAAAFHTTIQNYTFELWGFFVHDPVRGYIQLLVLVIAWAHAMLGLHFWLRVQPWYARCQALALSIAVLAPVLALLGVTEAAQRIAEMAQDPAWRDAAFTYMVFPTTAEAATQELITGVLTWGFAGVIVALLAARLVRRAWERLNGVIRITYPDGRHVEVLRGTTVLEASRLANVPHASVCGGRGRCSTCRVRVRSALPGPPPPSDEERRVLNRIRATANVRLACMLRPDIDVEVTPLLPPFAQAHESRTLVDLAQGGEREIAILFADLRDFTMLSEGRLPYDIVFVLNRYFAAMGRAVEAAGGRVDKFIGDGVMALFGVDTGAKEGCRAALSAAREMAHRMVELNATLAGELTMPLRIGIGIHVGPAIVGEIGYGAATTITAIGDPVNTASRLEELTKEYQCELIVSADVITAAGLDRTRFIWHDIEIRGKQERLAVAILANGSDLPEVAEPAAAG
ncbi:MAG TPA: adenylate/guanylate cyclase domain-containing protein [Stellaceae bacterium]|nr:adenylate/guanylate cyclase domain-containing protein [Stellaceae bacterium]